MSANITQVGPKPDPAPVPAPATPTAAEATSNSPAPSDLRLVIEEDHAAGCFVYKTVDWRTGAVVQQLPREEMLKLREAADYTAGAVIDTRA
jgi:flagellar protein FlaG